jgi:hypothetical protein
MSKTFKAAIYETHGNPAEVLRIVEQPWPHATKKLPGKSFKHLGPRLIKAIAAVRANVEELCGL